MVQRQGLQGHWSHSLARAALRCRYSRPPSGRGQVRSGRRVRRACARCGGRRAYRGGLGRSMRHGRGSGRRYEATSLFGGGAGAPAGVLERGFFFFLPRSDMGAERAFLRGVMRGLWCAQPICGVTSCPVYPQGIPPLHWRRRRARNAPMRTPGGRHLPFSSEMGRYPHLTRAPQDHPIAPPRRPREAGRASPLRLGQHTPRPTLELHRDAPERGPERGPEGAPPRL